MTCDTSNCFLQNRQPEPQGSCNQRSSVVPRPARGVGRTLFVGPLAGVQERLRFDALFLLASSRRLFAQSLPSRLAMSSKIRCPKCQSLTTVEHVVPGTVLTCSSCKAAIRVPFQSASSGQPKAEPVPGGTSTKPPARQASWEWIVGPLAFCVMAARKFGCFDSQSKVGQLNRSTGSQQSSNQSPDIFGIVLGLIVLALIAWGFVALVRWIIQISNERSVPSSHTPPPPPPPQQQASTTSQWWLSVAGQVTGPCSTDAILDSLRCGDVSPSTQACPVGSTEWKPITSWPAFSGAGNGR